MKLYGSITVLDFDAVTFERSIRTELVKLMNSAIAAFVETAAPNVPVYTGMARGSFLNAVQYLRTKGISVGTYIPTTPQRTGNNGRALRYTHTDNSTHPKTPMRARMFSTRPNEIVKWKGGKLTFTYQTKVRHFNINDEYRGWLSFQKGKRAYDSVITQGLYKNKNFPLDFLTMTVYSIGRGGVPRDNNPVKRLRQQRTFRN